MKNGKLVKSLQLELLEACPLWDKDELENLKKVVICPIRSHKQQIQAKNTAEFLENRL